MVFPIPIEVNLRIGSDNVITASDGFVVASICISDSL